MEAEDVNWHELPPETRVVLRELVVHRQKDGRHIVECPAAGSFVEADDECLFVLDHLRAEGGATISQVQAAYERRFRQDVDLHGFLTFLGRRHMVGVLGDEALGLPPSARPSILNRIQPEWVRWMRSPWLTVLVVALFSAWVARAVHDPRLLPGIQSLFLSPRPIESFVLAVVGLVGMAYIHELGHFFTARSYGISPRINVSSRLMVMVLQTDVTAAWRLPLVPRLRIFLAGIGVNLFFIATSGLAGTILVGQGVTDPVETFRIVRFVGIINAIPIAFQFLLFTRTDLYYVLAALMGERNLAGDARAYWRNRFMRPWRRAFKVPAAPCPDCRHPVYRAEPHCIRCGHTTGNPDPDTPRYAFRSRRRLASYGVFMLVGQAFALTLIFRMVPRFLRTLTGLAVDSWRTAMANDAYWLAFEAAAFVVVQLLLAVAILRIVWRRVRTYLRPPLRFTVIWIQAVRRRTRIKAGSPHE